MKSSLDSAGDLKVNDQYWLTVRTLLVMPLMEVEVFDNVLLCQFNVVKPAVGNVPLIVLY